jgi:serine/threonine protein kinase
MSASLDSSCWSGGALDRRTSATMPTDHDVRAPSIGTVIAGTYRLDGVLGTGAMASVFAATHLRNANRVAIKILHFDLTNNVDVRVRFLREGYAANSVRHAGTVRALDDGTTESGAAFFVMELLEGETLEAFWERRGRQIPPLEVAELMVQLLDILSAAHAKGIVHRDIKPENLFVEHDGTLRVLDFGVARVLEGTLTETRAGSIIGTLPYMAPEQTLGKCHEVDARSDLWSVGATAFTLVSGRFVHDAETPEEMMVFNGSRQPRSLAEVAPDVASDFVDVVDRALRFDRTERWSSALAMRAAFAEMCRRARGPGLSGGALSSASKEAEPRAEPLSRAHLDVVSADPPFVPTLVSSGAPGVNPVPARGRPAPVIREARGRRGPWWATAGAVALVLAGAVEARSALDGRPSELASTGPASAPASSTASVELGAAADAIAEPRSVPAADNPVQAAVATLVERGSEAGPEAPTAAITRPATPAHAGAVASSPRPDARVAPPPPDDCTPPFVILPVTGKKHWKRQCL